MDYIVTFPAQLEYLPQMLEWVRNYLTPLSLEVSDKNKFEIAAEEILVNIICYAYEGTSGMVEMSWKEQMPCIQLTFKDFGKPFNPLTHQKLPAKSLPIEKKDIGGLGIFFVKNFVDQVEYQYINGANILTISKNVGYA